MITDHQPKEPLPAHRLLDLEADQGPVLARVALGLEAAPVVDLAQEDAAHRQRLLGDRRHLGQRLLSLGGDALTHQADAPLRHDERGHEHHGEQRETPVEHDHRDERGDDRRGVAHDARHKGGEHSRDSADVVLKPRLDDSRLGAREEGELHALELVEQRDPQVARHPVSHVRRHPGLPHAQARRRDDRCRS